MSHIPEIQYIESSQTWTCPKAGRWKVICVGGGSSGGLFPDYNLISYDDTARRLIFNPGGSTSFGSYLTANGGKITVENSAVLMLNRHNGYLPGNNGFEFLKRSKIPNLYVSLKRYNTANYFILSKGYGAGGFSRYIQTAATDTSTTHCQFFPLMGIAGEIKDAIVDLALNEEITCTIGAGGAKASFTASQIGAFYASSGYTVKNTDVPQFNNSIVKGKDGVIVLQYLGA